jgi:transcriptional regulator with XRE-family HTH domain
MAKERHDDPVMTAVKERFEASSLTQQALGEKMGYPAASARSSVSQFLNSGDPHISMLRRFADAMGIAVTTLLKN